MGKICLALLVETSNTAFLHIFGELYGLLHGQSDRRPCEDIMILTLDHGEAVEAEDVPVLDPPAGQGVVGPVRVQPRLEPDPGVLQLRPLTRLLAAAQ